MPKILKGKVSSLDLGYNIPMNIFKNYTMTWWQVGLLKLAVLCIGVVLGSHWPQAFVPYTAILLIVAIVLGIYLLTIKFKNN